MKLNIGASKIWEDHTWHILDHKMAPNEENKIVSGIAQSIDLPDETCDVVFASHVFEHIPHLHLPIVLSEINRVLRPGGVLRFLTPNLQAVAKAYAEEDWDFFDRAKKEDPSIRSDLGLGGMLMNFIVSPGQDTVLLNRTLDQFIAGYAHLYSYDFRMMEIMLAECGFHDITNAQFTVSLLDELRTPLHVSGFEKYWQPLNPEFFEANGLIHEMRDGVYHCNFVLNGFDRDPVTSLIVECRKDKPVSKEAVEKKFNMSPKNYNRYAFSLLFDEEFKQTLNEKRIEYPVVQKI